jgi:hypothetical protein
LLESVATDGNFAIYSAEVIIVRIAVITLFGCLYQSITARRQGTESTAPVGIVCITVVTLFGSFANTVSTDGKYTIRRTVVVVMKITVVTLFQQLDKSIATGRISTDIGTRIGIDCIAIITLFACPWGSNTVSAQRKCTTDGTRSKAIKNTVITLFAF